MSGHDRLLGLLTDRATMGLSPDESEQLDRLLAEQDEFNDDDIDLAAAAADLAFQLEEPYVETMPEDLKRRILEQAKSHPARPVEQPGLLSLRHLGWYAAAAMLVLFLWAPWSTKLVEPGPAIVTPPGERRQSLIESSPDVIQVAWQRPEIPGYEQVSGDVVWSQARQTGFMRLRGLPSNRKTDEQYQLWIVDPSRDQHPIDGGVFDITPGVDEIVVPIDAKLTVLDPQAFAITLEQPGGVVVSDGPLLVVAPVPDGVRL